MRRGDSFMHLNLGVAHMQPIVALAAGGILILLRPRLLNYIVAAYLILSKCSWFPSLKRTEIWWPRCSYTHSESGLVAHWATKIAIAPEPQFMQLVSCHRNSRNSTSI